MSDAFVPQHSVEAEMSVLGCCLLAKSAITAARAFLTPDDFYRPVHRFIYRKIIELHDSEQAVDMVTLGHAMGDKLEDAGGVQYLIEVQEAVPSARNAEYYAKIVSDLAMLRRLEEAGAGVVRIARDESMEPFDRQVAAQELVAGCYKTSAADFSCISEVEDMPVRPGIKTGIGAIDKRLSSNGLPMGQMTIFAARKKTGKTSGMVQFALHAARDQGKKVLYCTMADLTKQGLWARMRQSITGFAERPAEGFRGEAWDEKLADFRAAAKLWIADPRDLGYLAEPLALMIKSRHATKGYDLVVVDYVQKLDSAGANDRVRSLEKVSTVLSRMAEECGFALLAGSQLSNEGQTRYSQEFEDDCGLEIVADRPDMQSNQAFMEIKYNRFGPVGAFAVEWDPVRLRFNEVGRA